MTSSCIRVEAPVCILGTYCIFSQEGIAIEAFFWAMILGHFIIQDASPGVVRCLNRMINSTKREFPLRPPPILLSLAVEGLQQEILSAYLLTLTAVRDQRRVVHAVV
jgi:hypothetical protein